MRAALLLSLLGSACTSEMRAPNEERQAREEFQAQAFSAAAPSPSRGLARSVTDAAASKTRQDRRSVTMLIRMARVTLEVSSLDSAIGAARHIAGLNGGFAAGLDRNLAASWRPQAALTLRVPVSKLDAAIEALAALGQVEAVNVSSEDVSEEFVDVTARLENARRLERRLLELLSRGTGKLMDILQVEEKLASVREEVERIEGRRRYLQARAEMSTIELALHEAGTPPAPRVASTFGDAFGQARRNLVMLTTAAIEASGIVLPLAIVLGAAWVVLRRRRRLDPPAGATV